MDVNYLSILIDEIALEGLDGITLQGLWIRLENRLNLESIESHLKNYFWQIISNINDLSYYELPECRPNLILLDRNQMMNSNSNDSEPLEDIYKLFPIDNKIDKGSCAFYETRKPIQLYLIQNMTCEIIENKYGTKLVIVASQDIRNKVLSQGISVSQIEKLSVEFYCYLERIGRSRWVGEATFGHNSLKEFSSLSSYAFVMKKLLNLELLSQQTYTNNSKLYHLKRFFKLYLAKPYAVLYQMIKELKKQPNGFLTMDFLNKNLKVDNIRLVLKKVQLPKEIVSNYKSILEINPNVKKATMKNGNVKKVFGYRLTDPSFDFLKWYMNKTTPVDNDIDNSTKDEDLHDENNSYKSSNNLLYAIIEMSRKNGNNGVTIRDVCNAFNIKYKVSVKMCTRLVESKFFRLTKEDVGKIRRFKYILNYLEDNQQQDQLNETKMLLEIEDLEKELDPEVESKMETELSQNSITETNQEPIVKNQGQSLDPVVIVDDYTNTRYEITQRHYSRKYKNRVERREKLKKYCQTETVEHKIKMILMYIAKNLVFTSVRPISRFLQRNGYKYFVDHRTLEKLLETLAEFEYVRIFDIEFFHILSKSVKKATIYTSSRIKLQNSIVNIEIEKLKLSFLNHLKPNLSDNKVTFDENLKELFKSKIKFQREKLIHQFLFYLVYENNNIILPMDDETLCSFVFLKDDYEIWKRMIQSINFNVNNIPGTILLSNAIYNSPLSFIVQIFRIQYYVPEFKEYVKDEYKKHVLFKNLPITIQKMFSSNKHFLLRRCVLESIQCLCSYGLLQMSLYNKNDVVVYVNRNASIKDTRLGRNQMLRYHFDSIQDVEEYWNKLKLIALSNKNSASLKCTSSRLKKMNFIYKCSQNVNSISNFALNDTGAIPGDGKGVCGFNSTICVHLSRNWFITYIKRIRKPRTTKNNYKKIIVQSSRSKNKSKAIVIKKQNLNTLEKQYRLKILDQVISRKCKSNFSGIKRLHEYDAMLFCQLAASFCYTNPSKVFTRQFLKRTAQSHAPSLKKLSDRIFSKKLYKLLNVDKIIKKKFEAALHIIKSNDKIVRMFYCEEVLKNFKSNFQAVLNLYDELLNFLISKYETIDNLLALSNDQFNFDSIEDFFEKFEIIKSSYNDDKTLSSENLTMQDIRFNTFQSVILSIFLSQQDKTNLELQLRHILQQFDEGLKRTVVELLKKLQILCFEKQENDDLNFPYNLSASFWNFLKFSYTPEYFYNLYSIQENILNNLEFGNVINNFDSSDYHFWITNKLVDNDQSKHDINIDITVPEKLFLNFEDCKINDMNIQDTYNWKLNNFNTNITIYCKDKLYKMLDVIKSNCNIIWDRINKWTIIEESNENQYDILNNVQDKINVERDVLLDIVAFIKSFVYRGVSASQLKDKYESLFQTKNIKLFIVLDLLETEAKIILKTGINCIVYVHKDYWHPWVVNSFRLTRLEKEKIIGSTNIFSNNTTIRKKFDVPITPWMKIDGSFNRRLFDHLLCMLLSYCIEKYEVEFIEIVKHYTFLSAVQIFFLLKFLQDLKCVQILKRTKLSKRVSLFSEIESFTEVEANDLDNFEEMIIQINACCSIKMANYVSNKKYTIFLTK